MARQRVLRRCGLRSTARTAIRFCCRCSKGTNQPGARQDVGGQPAQTVYFGRTPQRADVVLFELPEVVLGLRVHQSEDHAGVGLTVDVRHTVGVAIDGDRRLRGGGGECREEKETGQEACPTCTRRSLMPPHARVTAPSLALETNLQYLANTPAL